MRKVRDAEQRVAMSYEFEYLLDQLRSKKHKSESQTESQRMGKLNKILSQSIETFELNVNGNQTTKYDFIKDELNVSTPNSIENCSIQIYDGISRLKDELDIIDTASATIDIDESNENNLICNLDIEEKSRLTASIGATHDMNSTSQVNGSLSVGIRNLFGEAEKLNLSANLGLGTTNDFSIFGIRNTSNEYNIMFHKPRYYKYYNLVLRGFQQKLDRIKSSSYHEDSTGISATVISNNNKHLLTYNYHLRSMLPSENMNNVNINNISPSISDDSILMSIKSSLQYKYILDKRNHESIPSNGYKFEYNNEISGIGGDVDFIKSLLSFNYHITLPRLLTNINPPNYTTKFKSILNIGLQTGFVIPWKKYVNIMGDNHIRIIDRIIPMAGLQLRGFEHAQIGPKDTNDYVHCDFLFSGGSSLNVPIQSWLFGNLFFNFSYCNLLRHMSLNNGINGLINNTNISTGASFIIPFPVGRLEIGYSYPIKNTNNNPFSPWFWAFDVQFF